MYNFKFKICVCLLFLFIVSCNSIVTFAVDENMAIDSEQDNTVFGNFNSPHNYQVDSKDITFDNNSLNIDYNVTGDIQCEVKDFSITPSVEETFQIGGIINGNLNLTADNVKINSEYTKNGDESLTIKGASIISGNVFVVADSFILDPGCEISGDLYVKASKVELARSASIDGNVYIYADSADVSCLIGKDLYVISSDFNMGYYGYVEKSLYLFSSTSSMSGAISRNCYLTCETLTTTKDFLSYGNVTVDSNVLVFSGEIQGNAIFNSKNIEFKNFENNSDVSCVISGNLNYSSETSNTLPEGIVLGETIHEDYKNKLNLEYPFILKAFSSSSYSKPSLFLIITSAISVISIVFFIILAIRIILKKNGEKGV